MKSAFVVALFLFALTAHAVGIFSDDDEKVFDKSIGWQGVGTVVHIGPDGVERSFSAVIPIRMNELEISPQEIMIVTFDSNSTIEMGTTITSNGSGILFGLGSDSRVGFGVRTPGPVMVYGMGNAELTINSRVNGIPENELGSGVGVEAGLGVVTRKFVMMTGAGATVRGSILNPNHDYGEVDLGVRGRIAVKDVLYLRIEADQSQARTREGKHSRARASLDYKLNPGYRPWTPALRVMFGIDGRIDRIEDGAGKFATAQYAGAHVIFYKR